MCTGILDTIPDTDIEQHKVSHQIVKIFIKFSELVTIDVSTQRQFAIYYSEMSGAQAALNLAI